MDFSPEDEPWTAKITTVARNAADLIKKHGWQQNTMTGENGELCIMEAGHQTKVHPGLSHVLREVLAYSGYSEHWNDTKGRTKEEVVEVLRTIEITPDLLRATFGPNWEMVCYCAEMFASFGKREMQDWRDIRDEERDFRVLQHIDRQMPPGEQDRRGRSAVCAAECERAVELGFKPSGPSVGLMMTRYLRPGADREMT